MKNLISAFFSGCLLLVAVVTSAAGNPDAGEAKVIVCAACHGATGASDSAAFPNLAGQGEKYLIKQLNDLKSGDRVIIEMTGMVDLMTDQDIADIAAFFSVQTASITGSEEIEDEAYGLSASEFLALGEKVYRGGNLETSVPACTGCHSPRGNGNAPAGYPALAGQHGDYLIKQLTEFQNNLRVNDGDSKTMRGVAKRMSDLEIRAVANYISGLN